MSKLRQRSIFGVLVVVLGALVFLVSSAFIIDRGYPKVLAAIVGGLAFPVLPVAWQAWGERSRAKKQAEAKKPSTSTLTGFDRFWLRFVVIAAAVIGPMIGMAKFGVVHAAIRHGLWFIPEFEPGLGMLGEGPRRDLTRVEPLLKRIPSDAEGVVISAPSTINGEGLIAFSNHDVVAAAEGTMLRDDDMIRRINDAFKGQHYLLLDPIAMVIDRDITVAATDKWKFKVEPAPGGLSSALRRELERAPADAQLFMAFTPKTVRDAKSIRSGAMWTVNRDKNLVIEARIEALDVRRAYELITAAKGLKAAALPISGDCKTAVGKILDHLELAQVGTVVTARVTIPEGVGDDLSRCLD
ncbi:MAG: hypothetical protein ABI591_11190 [Kofleriaceae bacterium]